MDLPKCQRANCRPTVTEHSYRSCDRFSIWCAGSGCYRNAVGATIESAGAEWAYLICRPSPEDKTSSLPIIALHARPPQ
jgi:hypothetical protein